MKIQSRLAAALAALLIISSAFPVHAVSTDELLETTASSQSDTLTSDDPLSEEGEAETSEDHFSSSDDTTKQESSAAETEESDLTASDETEESGTTDPGEAEESDLTASDEADESGTTDPGEAEESGIAPPDEAEESDLTEVPNEAPMFSAYIKYSPQGYVVKSDFTEFLPNTVLVQPLYSLDGEIWQDSRIKWTKNDLKQQSNVCLYSIEEPLAGYLSGQLDCFYLKLQITLENGSTYETKTAVIDRNATQPIPEELTPVASFVPAMLIRQWSPFKRYGQYQITVSADATPEEIYSLLPDTLPINIQLYAGIDFVTNVIVDCPVTWKPLSLSRLAPDESVAIEDAAEEILIPAGTLLKTPYGTFQLNEPLGMDNDEIRLVLNVVAENADPTGVLACEISGLQISFHLKPTGATAIRAYTLSEGGADWVEIPDTLLPEKVNAPSSTANSTYTLLLKNTAEPYQSYLAAEDEPTPFLVGLKIEGGVYDGRQLILAWPDTYELPTVLPDLKGSGGNECNAGSDNKGDSTSEGQRPNLPQNPEDGTDKQEPEPPQKPTDDQNAQEMPQSMTDDRNAQETPQSTTEEQDAQETPQSTTEEQDAQESEQSQPPEYKPEVQRPSPDIPDAKHNTSQTPEEQQYGPLKILDEEFAGQFLKNIPDRYTAKKDALQISMATAIPSLIVDAGSSASAPAVIAENASPVWEETDLQTGHNLRRLILPAMAITALGSSFCIILATRKAAGVTSGKLIHKIYSLLHLK